MEFFDRIYELINFYNPIKFRIIKWDLNIYIFMYF